MTLPEVKCPCGVTVGLWFSNRLKRYACPECWDDNRLVHMTDESGDKVIGRVYSCAVGDKTCWHVNIDNKKQWHTSSFTNLKGAVDRLKEWSQRIPGARIWKEVAWNE